MSIHREALFPFLIILSLDICLSQKDCTGVDCSVLQNCIESVLDNGACCPRCTQKGCTCEGYQYYDCIQAGFLKGKVPEGESYFVDFGSTECLCPQGGGKISCRFIPCPEISPNCIEILQPADGCPQCGRIGCTHGNKKYEAGHSFRIDGCHVCHCPNEGGRLMCSPIPGCDLRSADKIVGLTAENNSSLRDISHNHDSQQTSITEPFSMPAQGNTLPLYKPDPPSFGTDDYDYTLAEPTSSTIQNLAQPLESTTVPPAHPDDRSHEPREESPNPEKGSDDEVTHNMGPTTTGGDQNKTSATATTTQSVATEDHRPQQRAGERTMRHNSHRNRLEQETLKDTTHTNVGVRHKHSQTRNHGSSHSVHHKGQEKVSMEHENQIPAGKEELASLYPTVRFSPTDKAPVRIREDDEEPQRQPQTLHTHQSQDVVDSTEESAMELVKTCCETGEKWASANGHCSNMEAPEKDRHSICWTAQQQCCLGFLRKSHCLAGINAARAGSVCEEDASNKCGTNSYKECCSCCFLGLQFRSVGHHCEAHQYLDFHCKHVFQTCCKGDERTTENQDGWHTIREKPALGFKPPPRKVSHSLYPKEAFTIGEGRDGENAVEGPVGFEDIDGCQGNICHHKCVNTVGSFRCECFPGYVLQDDTFTCAPDTVDEENRLKEVDRTAKEPTAPLPPPTQPAVSHNPCEGNICEQQCTPVGGKPRCSCFPGFSLRADGRSCEDIDECLSAHTCQLNERCVNTAGSYVCRRPITCPPGYQINDVDECGSLTQPCSTGFNCVNTAGSYICNRMIICSRGYHTSPDGSRCVDVDECQNGLHRCREDQLCHNMPGAYRCECQTGYQYNSFRRMCVDVNECWRYPGRLCAQTCVNTPGSYECLCTSGFRLSADGKNCEDVNECLASPCSQECANIYGSYQCYCRQGYYLREDGHTCEDIDECSQSIGHLCTYKCVNVPGSYQCACPEYGYTMSPNGRSCRDIDECTAGVHNCSAAETCYNIQGGYRCLSFTCPPNYRKVSNTRCERISCANYLECQNSPLRITYYYLSFQSNIIVPAEIFRIGPSPAYSGDNVIVTITDGNKENFFFTRKLNAYTGAVYLNRQVQGPRDFLINVEMKLWRQGTFTTFHAKIYVFITAHSL
ncbi:fibulin-2-like isoform 2-T2 [Pholidichthys leucotaenia]